jgi:hypothetical protein
MALKWIYTINLEKKPQSKIELWFLAPIATAFPDLEKQGFFLAIVFLIGNRAYRRFGSEISP